MCDDIGVTPCPPPISKPLPSLTTTSPARQSKPSCGRMVQYARIAVALEKIGKVEGKSARPGLYYCGACKSQFTVTVGTIFERSKVPLSKWWFAIHLLASSKKGMSAHQLHRMIGVTYQTAWFMEHRIREAMRDGDLAPMGGGGSVVEVDETYIGRKNGFEVSRGGWHKNAVLTLVERGGSARSFHIDSSDERGQSSRSCTRKSRPRKPHHDR